MVTAPGLARGARVAHGLLLRRVRPGANARMSSSTTTTSLSSSPAFRALFNEEVHKLADIFKRNKVEIRCIYLIFGGIPFLFSIA